MLRVSNQKHWLVSIFIHLSLLIICILLAWVFSKNPEKIERFEFTIKEVPDFETAPIAKNIEKKMQPIQSSTKEIDTNQNQNVPEVFGIRKDSLKTSGSSGIHEKAGNTLGKDPDSLILEDDRELPTPKPAYLVSQMPVLLAQIDPVYPEEARKKNIEGQVVLKVLIDEEGKVARSIIVEDPGYGFGKAAKEAMMDYTFKAARIENQNVAVEIRYVVRFELK
ncbi:MAG: energy transducer TonB [Bdellovibrionales bacterium]|nr:energy transducer TonB [Bdellovibrionales bacterium]